MMKTMNLMIAGAALAGLLLTAGCSTLEKSARAKPAEVSGFIPQPELLIPQKYNFPFHYFYLKPNAGTYKNVYVAPVNTEYLRKNGAWAKLDQKMAASLGSDIAKLATFTRNAFVHEFAFMSGANTLQVVDSAKTPDTLVVELAIVAIKPTKAELIILGTAGNLLLPGIGIITGKLGAGSVTLECRIRDAKTGEIVAMFANTETDQRALLNFAGMTWYTSAEKNIRVQAISTAKIFSGSDYTKVRRRLFKIVNF